MILGATPTSRSVAAVVAIVLALGWLAYVLFNLRKGRDEVGSEIELAPNRKPYFEDDVMETVRLQRFQVAGIGMLVVIAVGLAGYWLNEPGRAKRAEQGFTNRFADWGSRDFATTAEGGFNCAGCHGVGGIGGTAPYVYTDPRTGEAKNVAWNAPALNAILYRYTEDEVRYILNYGRPFSPMSAWGTIGGGPMNEQQINDLIAYIRSFQLKPEEVRKLIDDGLAAAKTANPDKSDGELLFNLEVAGGAYSCARCHTSGWSYGDPKVSGGGAMGPSLLGGATTRQFPLQADHEAFITVGSENGKKYGVQGQGSGRMPGFGVGAGPMSTTAGIYTPEEIRAIVEYERSL